MKVEEQGNDYLKINLFQEGKLDYAAFTTLSASECFVPFSQVTEEENRVLYYLENYIPMAEYLNMKTLNFEETKRLFLACVNTFENVRNAEEDEGNIVADVNYVYVEPVTRQIKFLYLPTVVTINPDSFRTLLKNILFVVQTENAEMLLGSVVDVMRHFQDKETDLERFKECVLSVDSNVKVVEKEVEVDRIVEKIIEKPKKYRSNMGESLVFYTLVYIFAIILLPALLANFIDSSLLAGPKLLNILLCLSAILATVLYSLKKETGYKDDKIVVTMQPQEKKTNGK